MARLRLSGRIINDPRLSVQPLVNNPVNLPLRLAGLFFFNVQNPTDGITGPDGAVVMLSANGLLGTGFASQNGFLKVTTPSSLSLTSNRVTTNY